jgi:hypothetical protein
LLVTAVALFPVGTLEHVLNLGLGAELVCGRELIR